MSKGKKGLIPAGDIITPTLMREINRGNGPTPIQQRLIDAAVADIEHPDQRSILYQHSVLCQTYLPYRNPGDDKREWDRLNGDVHLEVRAGKAMHPKERRLVQLGLPFGPKCRLVLMHINQLALVSQSPRIEVEDSLTAFVRRVLNLDPKGRNITEVKAQLARLSAADITLGIVHDDPDGTGTAAGTGYLRIVKNFDLWFAKNENQRILWPSVIDLSLDYFNSLISHAVPLDEHHIAALSHSALALDIYAWLAQRLHRVPANKPAFVSWAALHGQFGQGYTGDQAIKKFRSVFKVALKQVLVLYKAAKITEDDRRNPSLFIQGGTRVWREPRAKGLTLHNSLPPVPRRLITVS
jgi:replication initiator protein